MYRVFVLLIGYFAGCFLTAEIVSRSTAGVSASELGTGNPGMANIAHCLGVRAGIATLTGDILKVVFAVLIARLLFPSVSFRALTAWTGLGCILGHNLPFWRHFRGGKGVAVTCAVLILMDPVRGIPSAIFGLIVVLLSGYLPAGAVVIPLSYTILSAFANPPEITLLALVFTLMMFWRHYPGLRSIREGTCPKAHPFAFLKKRH